MSHVHNGEGRDKQDDNVHFLRSTYCPTRNFISIINLFMGQDKVSSSLFGAAGPVSLFAGESQVCRCKSFITSSSDRTTLEPNCEK